MRRSRAVVLVSLVLVLSVVSESTWALGSKKAMYVGATIAGLPEKPEGSVDITNAAEMVFRAEKGGVRIPVPWKSIEDLEYGQRVSRRWKTAIFLTVFAVFSKGRKHYVTISYKDTAGVDQAAVFEFGKEIIRPTLATLRAKSRQAALPPGRERRQEADGRDVRLGAAGGSGEGVAVSFQEERPGHFYSASRLKTPA